MPPLKPQELLNGFVGFACCILSLFLSWPVLFPLHGNVFGVQGEDGEQTIGRRATLVGVITTRRRGHRAKPNRGALGTKRGALVRCPGGIANTLSRQKIISLLQTTKLDRLLRLPVCPLSHPGSCGFVAKS